MKSIFIYDPHLVFSSIVLGYFEIPQIAEIRQLLFQAALLLTHRLLERGCKQEFFIDLLKIECKKFLIFQNIKLRQIFQCNVLQRQCHRYYFLFLWHLFLSFNCVFSGEIQNNLHIHKEMLQFFQHQKLLNTIRLYWKIFKKFSPIFLTSAKHLDLE